MDVAVERGDMGIVGLIKVMQVVACSDTNTCCLFHSQATVAKAYNLLIVVN